LAGAAFDNGVADAQYDLAALLARIQAIEKEEACAADVQEARGGRCEPNASHEKSFAKFRRRRFVTRANMHPASGPGS
jgi:hypothetical protein